MKKIKVAVVGTGFIGPAHIEALRRLPNIEVLGLCEANIGLAREKADALGIERAYIFEDLLLDAEIECVHVCTPNFLHYSQSKALLLAGKHVVCEKPLATKIEDAEELVKLAAETGLVNAVHFNLRYYPLVRQMRTMREKGDLGEIYSIMGSYLQDWLFYQTDYNWRLHNQDAKSIFNIFSLSTDYSETTIGSIFPLPNSTPEQLHQNLIAKGYNVNQVGKIGVNLDVTTYDLDADLFSDINEIKKIIAWKKNVI